MQCKVLGGNYEEKNAYKRNYSDNNSINHSFNYYYLLYRSFILSLFIEIPEITDRNVTTCYGDNITLSRRVEFDYEIYYSAICEEQFLFAASPDYSNYYYYPSNAQNAQNKNWDEIINSFKEGDVRIYELN